MLGSLVIKRPLTLDDHSLRFSVSLPEMPFRLAEWYVASPFLTYPPFASLNLAPEMGPFLFPLVGRAKAGWKQPLLACQNRSGGERRCFVILVPRRTDRASEPRNPAAHSARRNPKCLFGSLLEFSLSNYSDRNLQTFACLPDRIAKEFALRRMNQRVRRQNLRKRGQRAAGGLEHRRTSQAISSRVQFPDHFLDGR